MEDTIWVTILGLTAGFLTTLSFLPQVIQIWRSKKADDISALTFSVFATGVFLWLFYGIAIKSVPVIIPNAITFVLAVSILYLKWKYRSRPKG
jgi:MtN3 and saliva related transmembrane protein